jgi:hypothetical protein
MATLKELFNSDHAADRRRALQMWIDSQDARALPRLRQLASHTLWGSAVRSHLCAINNFR